MTQANVPYPANPQQVNPLVTAPSAAFKATVGKVMANIVFFFVVYLLLVIASVVLAIACVYFGIMLIGFMGHWLGIVAGLGIISMGILVFVFLVKFIFSVKKYNDSGTTTVTEEAQPVLFAFIRQLTKDTQTPFPKKIVLSAEVNASVYYNDSFWSMLFPVRKNLQIGLGLVNTLTVSEFKAVMAHEFGHFSQRSMKLGSFVYNVNKVIYNMLYENKDFSGFVSGWGNLHWGIYIFVLGAIEIIKIIQKVLQLMYKIINKAYMSLSREMEFHADAVAASVSGSNYLITALRKIEISDTCYNTAVQKANDWLKDKKAMDNIYENHNTLMHFYASEFNLPLENNAPLPEDSFYNRFQQSRINIKDQWASHPSREDRETKLNQLNIEAANDSRSAWILFNNAASLQQELTSVLYETVPADAKENKLSATVFKEKYLKDVEIFTLPEDYKNYYDNRSINDFDVDKLFDNSSTTTVSKVDFEALLSDEKSGLPKKLQANIADVQLLEAITAKQMDIKSFDFDGVKYAVKEAAPLMEKIKKETETLQQQLEEDDKQVALFFYAAALQKGHTAAVELKEKYRNHFANRKKVTEYTACCQRAVDAMAPLLMGQQVSITAAEDMASTLRAESNSMRTYLTEWVANGIFNNTLAVKESAGKFINTNYRYFSVDTFLDTELRHLNDLISDSTNDLAIFQFKSFKDILEYQLEVYNNITT